MRVNNDVPEVLLGVLKEDDYVESLKALRNRLAFEMSGGYCDHCQREGPRDVKDTAALALRIESVLGKIEAAVNPAGKVVPPAQGSTGVVFNFKDAQSRVAAIQRTGPGTQTTDAPQSVAKRQDGYGRRPGAGRKKAE